MERNKKNSIKGIIILCSLAICNHVQAAITQCDATKDTNCIANALYICNRTDSLQTDTAQMLMIKSSASKRNFTDSRLYQMTFVGLPLIITGAIMKGEDTHFRSLRNGYMKEFHHTYDNYSQYLPLAVMLGMKTAGVKSRNSWSRMLASDAFSAAIMAGAVESIKRTAKVERPDGTDNRSFPSGHTATAFMTATMLTKEYGHLSPWIGIGAYSVAAGTGVMRVANNKHWVSDVLTGAGIGIIATEIGYYIADLLFKEKGVTHFDTNETFSRFDHPSFFNIYLGANIPLSYYDIDETNEFRTSTGCAAGFEGAYFFNPYIGAGGRFTASNVHIITNKTEAEDNSADSYTLMAGPYFSYPITSRWLVGSKILAGCMTHTKFRMTNGKEIPRNSVASFGTGLSFTYKAREHYGIRFFLDYNVMQPQSNQSGEWVSTLTIGTGFGINL